MTRSDSADPRLRKLNYTNLIEYLVVCRPMNFLKSFFALVLLVPAVAVAGCG